MLRYKLGTAAPGGKSRGRGNGKRTMRWNAARGNGKQASATGSRARQRPSGATGSGALPFSSAPEVTIASADITEGEPFGNGVISPRVEAARTSEDPRNGEGQALENAVAHDCIEPVLRTGRCIDACAGESGGNYLLIDNYRKASDEAGYAGDSVHHRDNNEIAGAAPRPGSNDRKPARPRRYPAAASRRPHPSATLVTTSGP